MSRTQALIYVVDDDDDVRESLLALLGDEGYETQGFADGESFLAALNPNVWGCVLLDVRMPSGISGLQVYDRLKAMQLPLPVIFLTAHATIDMAVRVAKAGAVDVLEKVRRDVEVIEKFDYSDVTVLDKIREALALAASIRETNEQVLWVEDRLMTLTLREREVLDLVLLGHRNAQIEGELGIGQGSVELHRKNAMAKFDASRAQQVAEHLAPMKRARGAQSVQSLWVQTLQDRLNRLSDEDLQQIDAWLGFDSATPEAVLKRDARDQRLARQRIFNRVRVGDLAELGRWLRQFRQIRGEHSLMQLLARGS